MRFFPGILSVFFMIIQLPVVDQDASKVVGHEPVHAKVGDDVILPCHLEPPFDVNNLTVEWKFQNRKIGVYRSRAMDEEASDSKYKDRVFFFLDQFHFGNISLKLTKVTQEDEGNYTCSVPNLESQVKKDKVILNVDKNGPRGNSTGPGEEKMEDNKGITIGIPVSVAAFIIIIIAGICYWKRNQIFPCLNNNQQDVNNRNDDPDVNLPLNGGGNGNAQENENL